MLALEDGGSRVPAGAGCSKGEVCSGGSVCKDGWCVCPDPSMTITGNGICIEKGALESEKLTPAGEGAILPTSSTHPQLHHHTYHLYTSSPIINHASSNSQQQQQLHYYPLPDGIETSTQRVSSP